MPEFHKLVMNNVIGNRVKPLIVPQAPAPFNEGLHRSICEMCGEPGILLLVFGERMHIHIGA